MPRPGRRPAALFGRLWWPKFRIDGVVGYVPVSGGLMTAVADGLIHAVKVDITPTRRTTVETVCGIERAKPLLIPDVDPKWAVIPVWPSPERFGRLHRCDDCVAITHKTRPDSMWQGLSMITETVPA